MPPSQHHHDHHPHMLDAPDTPKISNGVLKRGNEDCSNFLQRSLKRMKVTSASPGELRLQRDFKHAVCCAGWIPVGSCCNAWKVPADDNLNNPSAWFTVKQSLEDPLHLIVYDSSRWTFWVDIPRLFPHRPPVITRIQQHQNPSYEVVFQAAPEDPQVDAALRRGAVVIRGWTPLMRLQEILTRLVFPILIHGPTESSHICTSTTMNSNNISMEEEYDRTERTSHLRLQPFVEADCATEVRQHLLIPCDDESDGGTAYMRDADLFPPNRFDLGFHPREPLAMREEAAVMMHE